MFINNFKLFGTPSLGKIRFLPIKNFLPTKRTPLNMTFFHIKTCYLLEICYFYYKNLNRTNFGRFRFRHNVALKKLPKNVKMSFFN